MIFDMSASDNSAIFVDDLTGIAVLVESCDNKLFEVRIGTLSESHVAGTIQAKSDEELNKQLLELLHQHQANQD